MSSGLTLSVEPATLARLERAAADRGMTREALAEAAVAVFLDEDEAASNEPLAPWQEEQIRRGLADADAGRFASDEDVARVLRRYE